MEVKYNPPPELKHGTVDVTGIPAESWWFLVGVIDNLAHPLLCDISKTPGLPCGRTGGPEAWLEYHLAGAAFIRKIRGDSK